MAEFIDYISIHCIVNHLEIQAPLWSTGCGICVFVSAARCKTSHSGVHDSIERSPIRRNTCGSFSFGPELPNKSLGPVFSHQRNGNCLAQNMFCAAILYVNW